MPSKERRPCPRPARAPGTDLPRGPLIGLAAGCLGTSAWVTVPGPLLLCDDDLALAGVPYVAFTGMQLPPFALMPTSASRRGAGPTAGIGLPAHPIRAVPRRRPSAGPDGGRR
ncbi:hypothetical protein [Micromonospora sp. ATCC 39149]|uniref:Uncharacterized protein n=1 Tax=Micromonospora carbonacea TaxID=47853 RepID=A0A7D6CEF3_9ACTN|nr:hypothetical protein [Micromonospora sp. ATCC 39149]QLJ96248.1 hypothetical protein HZU44_14330 [Micromonospora carbonacea]